jgi:hypothetical protein
MKYGYETSIIKYFRDKTRQTTRAIVKSGKAVHPALPLNGFCTKCSTMQ